VAAGQESLVPIEFSLKTLEVDEARFVLAVVDADGSPVDGAEVKVGEEAFTTGDGGSIVIEDADKGAAPVTVSAKGYKPLSDEITVVGGNQTRTLTLEWVPQPVTVTVKTDKGDPLVAEVKWVGPVKVPDGKTGDDGNLTTDLRPGSWTLVAQAPDLGAGRAEVVVEPGVAPAAVTIELEDSRVEVVEGEVKILEQVFFDTGLATIRPESYAVLDEVANVLLLNPQITKVEVQGHTDNVGTDDTNLRLSQRRAQAVRDYLVGKGVKRSRLDAKGYGNSEPIADNGTDEGRGQNRRVQFEIVEE
jgi:outer membrane protein OmpA-like peptidoglycan-associated protein